jgi:hypothetical protein
MPRGHKTYLRLQESVLLSFSGFNPWLTLPPSQRQGFSFQQGVGVEKIKIMSLDLPIRKSAVRADHVVRRFREHFPPACRAFLADPSFRQATIRSLSAHSLLDSIGKSSRTFARDYCRYQRRRRYLPHRLPGLTGNRTVRRRSHKNPTCAGMYHLSRTPVCDNCQPQ